MDAPPAESAPPAPPEARGRVLLSRRMLWLCVVVATLVFFLWERPNWQNADAADAGAWWSYAVIPPLVAGALIFERRLGVVAWMLATVEVTAWKFCATYLFAQTMWMISPPKTPPHPLPAVSAEPRALDLLPTVIDPRDTGAVEGRVVTAGTPLAGAIVFVESGLEHYVFAPPTEVLRVVEEGGAITTEAEVAQIGQRVEARSGDLKLHTLIASTSEGDAFSIPLQSSGAWSSAILRPIAGVATLHCGVHQRSGESRRLLITSNPFWTKTDGSGAYRLNGIPRGRIHLKAIGDSSAGAGSADKVIQPGATARLDFSL